MVEPMPVIKGGGEPWVWPDGTPVRIDSSTSLLKERVAEAIYESDRHNRHNAEPWSEATSSTRAIYLRNAVAAIEAAKYQGQER